MSAIQQRALQLQKTSLTIDERLVEIPDLISQVKRMLQEHRNAREEQERRGQRSKSQGKPRAAASTSLRQSTARTSPVAVSKRYSTESQNLTMDDVELKRFDIAFRKALNGLKDVKGNWEARVDAVNELKQLVHHSPDAFWNDKRINALKGLKEHIDDLRSTVVREVCTLIEMSAQRFKLRFESVSMHFLPLLINRLYVTIKVIRQSCDHCLREVVSHSNARKSIPVLIKYILKDPHVAVRARCADYLSLALQSRLRPAGDVPSDVLFDISGAIEQSIQDADPDVRGSARSCFYSFADTWPLEADKYARLYTLTL